SPAAAGRWYIPGAHSNSQRPRHGRPAQPAAPANRQRPARGPWRRSRYPSDRRPQRQASTAANCPVRPISARTAAGSPTTSWPRTSARPASGASSVARMRTSVVLPAPFGPSRPNTIPAGTSSPASSSATVAPKRLTTPSTRTAGTEEPRPFTPVTAPVPGSSRLVLVAPRRGWVAACADASVDLTCSLSAVMSISSTGRAGLRGRFRFATRQVIGRHRIAVIRATGAPQNRSSMERRDCGVSGRGALLVVLYVWGSLFFSRVRIMSGSRRVPSGTGRDAGAGLGLRRRRAACQGRRARLSQRPAAEQGAADDRAAGEDPGGPPERGGVAVHQRLPGQGLAADQPGRGEVRREV